MPFRSGRGPCRVASAGHKVNALSQEFSALRGIMVIGRSEDVRRGPTVDEGDLILKPGEEEVSREGFHLLCVPRPRAARADRQPAETRCPVPLCDGSGQQGMSRQQAGGPTKGVATGSFRCTAPGRWRNAAFQRHPGTSPVTIRGTGMAVPFKIKGMVAFGKSPRGQCGGRGENPSRVPSRAVFAG